MRALALTLACGLVACSGSSGGGNDASTNADHDASASGGHDAATNEGNDASSDGMDAALSAGPDASTMPPEGGAPPVAIATSTDVSTGTRIAALAVDADHAYWVERADTTGSATSFHARRVAFTGGIVQDLGVLGGEATGIAVDDSDVFFCRADGIYALPKTGGAMRTVATTMAAPCQRRFGSGGPAPSLMRAADQIYWVEGGMTARRAPAAGGTAMTLATTSFATTLAIGGGQLFVGDGSGISRSNLDGTSSTRLVSGLNLPDGLGVVGADLFYLTGNGSAVNEIATAGGASTVVGFVSGTTSQYATDGTTLYLVDTGSPPTLYRAATLGLLPQLVATAPADAGYSAGLALAPGVVVWAVDHGVYTLPR